MQDVLAVSVRILHGRPQPIAAIAEAIEYLRSYETTSASTEVVKYEIEVRYNNGDEIRGTFRNKNDALRELRYWTE